MTEGDFDIDHSVLVDQRSRRYVETFSLSRAVYDPDECRRVTTRYGVYPTETSARVAARMMTAIGT